MLINALCEYYDMLAKAGKVLPDGYSNVKIHFLVSLTEEGGIDGIIDYRKAEEVPMRNGKVKENRIPRDVVMPQRTEKPGIDSNIAEHRPLYLFGLNFDKDHLVAEDNTGKAQKSHEALTNKNLEFLKGLDSPLINAYRRFLQSWSPAEETENAHLLALGRDYAKSGFAFCLSGYPDKLLHDEPQLKRKWEMQYKERGQSERLAQSAVSGEQEVIARIHNKIKGVVGGLTTGSVLIGYNNPSENSYRNEQSYNSNISESEMKKYTEALNYLLGNSKHKILLDDITVIFWVTNAEENYEDAIRAMLMGQSDQMDASQTEDMLRELLHDARQGKITRERLEATYGIDPNTDFYMAGLKPNSSRLAVTFVYRKQYADILWNIARFQEDMQITREPRSVSLARIKKEMISPKSKTETMNPALLSKLFESILYGRKYPSALLENVVRRIKTDRLDRISTVRAGMIKAYINRNYEKEEIKMALDKENHGQAYLCGRLFAVLEKLQQDASDNSLNRTIKDAYFASASSKPATVFPKLINLAQNHLKKVRCPVFYDKLMKEIINHLNGGFPDTLLLVDQGKFIVGYYQQYQSFFEKNEAVNNYAMEEEEDGN